MILYEKFGEDYDIIVEKMTKEEKIKLKEEVSKAVPKDVQELLTQNENTAEIDNQIRLSSCIPNASPEILKAHSGMESSGISSETSDSFAIKANLKPSNPIKNVSDESKLCQKVLSPIKDCVADGILESIAPLIERTLDNSEERRQVSLSKYSVFCDLLNVC